MIKLIYFVMLLTLTACATTWNSDRVKTVDGKNQLIHSANDSSCKQLQSQYPQLVDDLSKITTQFAGASASCSVSGPKDQMIKEMSDSVQKFKNNHTQILQSLKSDALAFDKCFQAVSPSDSISKGYEYLGFNVASFVSYCTTEGREAFQSAKSPNDFITRLTELSGRLWPDLFSSK